MNQAFLLDAALLQGHSLQSMLAEPHAVPLYGDLAPQAAAVGPWLVQDGDLETLRALLLPVRYGAAILRWQGELSDAVQHLRAMRVVTLEGGERFYLRFADHRPFQAILAMLRPYQRARLLGPFQSWTVCDRYDRSIDLAAGLAGRTASSTSQPLLHLSESDMDTLQDLQLRERLSAALMELQEPDLQPSIEPTQFRQVEAAADYGRARGISGWVMLRAIAMQAVRTQGRALQSSTFDDTVGVARQLGDAQPVLDWAAP